MTNRRALSVAALLLPVLTLTACSDDQDAPVPSSEPTALTPQSTDKDLPGMFKDVAKGLSSTVPKVTSTPEQINKKVGWNKPNSDYSVESFDTSTQAICVTATDGRYFATEADMNLRMWLYMGEGECSTEEPDAVVVGGAIGYFAFDWTKGADVMESIPMPTGSPTPEPSASPSPTS